MGGDFGSKLRASHRGMSLGPFACGASNLSKSRLSRIFRLKPIGPVLHHHRKAKPISFVQTAARLVGGLKRISESSSTTPFHMNALSPSDDGNTNLANIAHGLLMKNRRFPSRWWGCAQRWWPEYRSAFKSPEVDVNKLIIWSALAAFTCRAIASM